MNTIIPAALAPYLQECISLQSLTLLTSVLDTPTNWLVVRLLYLALHGQEKSSTTSHGAITSDPEPKAILISVWRSFDVWTELSRKCGLNLSEKIAAKHLCYVDGLSTVAPTSTPGSITLKSLTLQGIKDAVSEALQTISGQSGSSKVVVLIDGIDFLLACDQSATTSEMQNVLVDLQSQVHSTIITCSADTPLLHNMEAAATPLEHNHGIFIRQMGYQARLVFQLRPLETGHSKDVNGTVRVSRGGAWEGLNAEGAFELEEREWLYRFRGDGMVKVWGRGEA